MPSSDRRSPVRQWLASLGPGLVTGAADDDPSGISTYSIAGASAGYSMLWAVLVTTPMMIVVQDMCARVALCTGKGIIAAMRDRFPHWLVLALASIVVFANTFNIGADLAGMASALNLLLPIPVLAGVVGFAAFLAVAEIWLPYAQFARVLKWLTLTLFAYVATAAVIHIDWLTVLRHLVIPEFHRDLAWTSTLVGLLGTTITPYLFFWQSAMIIEDEKKARHRDAWRKHARTAAEIVASRIDTITGMVFSNAVAFFIVVTCAATLGAHGRHDITSARDAAEALRPLAGNGAYLLFTLGIVGTGLLAVPVLAGSSAYVLAEAFRFRTGLDQRPSRAPRFYGVIGAGLATGALMNLLGLDPIKALFWSAVTNGVVAVPLLVAIVLLANDSKCLDRWTNTRVQNVIAWATVVLMGGAALAMLPWHF